MKKFLKEYLYFSRGERNGTIILVVVMFLVFVFPYVYNAFQKNSAYQVCPDFIKEINDFYNPPGNDSRDNENHYGLALSTVKPDRLPVKTGVKGSGLTDKSDLQQSPTPDNPSVHQSPTPDNPSVKQSPTPDNPSVHQSPTPDNPSVHQSPTPDKPGPSVRMNTDINTADTNQLMMIRGIGPVLSRRILRYRDILGGYHDALQLLEVYGIDEERYLEIEPYVFADTSRIVKLYPFSDDFGVLLRHPYLDYEQVSEIFRFRYRNKLNSCGDLLQSDAFNEEDLIKLSPYFHFD